MPASIVKIVCFIGEK